MTLPDERYRSVMWASKFLRSIANDTKNYPRVPKAVREEARSILRHFPNNWDMEQAAIASPELFATSLEDVQRMFMRYELSKQNEDKTS